MKLTDFSDDVPEDDAGPEDIVKNELTQWLLGNGATGVYWEKANPWNHPTFRTKGTDRPDLLVTTEDGLSFVIETKHDNSGMYRAPVQLQRYWEKYVRGDEEYRAKDETIHPDAFVIGTGRSTEGYLFEKHGKSDVLQQWGAWGGSKFARKKGWIPKVEYNATKSAVRIQWQYAARFIDDHGDSNVGIGALLSTVLDGEKPGKPRLLYYLDGEEHWEGIA